MYLQYCSDLHLEFPMNREFIRIRPLQPKAKILLLAGDIVPFKGMKKHNDFFDFVSDHFEQTYWIPGNHEYYGSDINERSGSFCESIKSNVHLLNNKVVETGEFRLVFTTLWSRVTPRQQQVVERGLSDYTSIRFTGGKLSSDLINQFHLESVGFIHEALAQAKDKKTLVVSHHVPTFFNYPEIYRDSEINEGFATELYDLIHPSGLSYWIYGHHHCCVDDFRIGDTLLVTNQLGYVGYNEHRGFDGGRVIEM